MPFYPESWVNRGTPMPARADSEVPTGFNCVFNSQLYVSYQGQYNNQTSGGYYTEGTNVRVGCIARTSDGVTWSTVFDGQAAEFEGKRHWMPGQLFVIGSTLFAFMFSAGFNFVSISTYYPPGEIALMSSTNGTTWSKVKVFHSWVQQNNGFGSPSTVEVSVRASYWRGVRSGPSGEDADWAIISYALRADGVSGSFSERATPRFRSLDSGATWTEIVDMKGTYPFTGNPTTIDGPTSVMAVEMDSPAPYRWFMFGGSGTMNYSDDTGTTWTAVSFFNNAPFGAFTLNARGMVAFANGTGAFAPDVKISCDYGESFTTVTTGSYTGPANVPVSPVQFSGLEQILAVIRDTSGTATALWYTLNGGETWVKLGTLPTTFLNTANLGYLSGILILYTSTLNSAGGPQVWTCADQPTSDFEQRLLCPLLSPSPGGTHAYAWIL